MFIDYDSIVIRSCYFVPSALTKCYQCRKPHHPWRLLLWNFTYVQKSWLLQLNQTSKFIFLDQIVKLAKSDTSISVAKYVGTFMNTSWPLVLIFRSLTTMQLAKKLLFSQILLMTGFKQRTTGVGCNNHVNWAKTIVKMFPILFTFQVRYLRLRVVPDLKNSFRNRENDTQFSHQHDRYFLSMNNNNKSAALPWEGVVVVVVVVVVSVVVESKIRYYS